MPPALRKFIFGHPSPATGRFPPHSLQAKSNVCQAFKFVSFVIKKNDVQFEVKRRVFDAALMSSLLYGCQSFVGIYLKPIVKRTLGNEEGCPE